MTRSSNPKTTRGTLTRLLIGLTVLGVAGCGEAPEAQESVQTDEAPILGGWKTLTLKNGWEAHGGTAPAVGVVNGVVTFRGALKAPAGQVNPVAFVLDDPAYRPSPLDGLYLRTVLNGNVGGTLFYNPYNDGQGNTHQVYVYQDGVSPPGLGAAARAFVSLDGVAFDKSYGDYIEHDPSWSSRYQLREHGCAYVNGPCGAFVKLVDGFVRFQGLLGKNSPSDYGGYLFTLPDPKYIPSNNVTVPLNLGGGQGSNQSFGAITIYPDGQVYVNGNPPAAASSTSFEGVSFSKTLAGNVPLPLSNNWQAYSSRSVKVGKYGDVVRFQGAISGGTSATIGTLPPGYAPPKTVRLVAVAPGPSPATVVVNTLGVITVEGPPLSVSSLFLSLDGVSFGL